MDTVILIVGLVVSPIATIIGLILTHKTNLKTAEVLAIKTKSEAQKIEQEADELEIKNRLAQLTYYIKIVEDLRTSVEQLRKEKDALSDRVAKLSSENGLLASENVGLRQELEKSNDRLGTQEIEINTLREKVKILENKPA